MKQEYSADARGSHLAVFVCRKQCYVFSDICLRQAHPNILLSVHLMFVMKLIALYRIERETFTFVCQCHLIHFLRLLSSCITFMVPLYYIIYHEVVAIVDWYWRSCIHSFALIENYNQTKQTTSQFIISGWCHSVEICLPVDC